MSDNNTSLCYVLVLVLAAAVVIYGFIQLLQRQRPSENDVQVLQRQLRGLAYLILSMVILSIGISLCFFNGNGPDMVRDAIRSIRV